MKTRAVRDAVGTRLAPSPLRLHNAPGARAWQSLAALHACRVSQISEQNTEPRGRMALLETRIIDSSLPGVHTRLPIGRSSTPRLTERHPSHPSRCRQAPASTQNSGYRRASRGSEVTV